MRHATRSADASRRTSSPVRHTKQRARSASFLLSRSLLAATRSSATAQQGTSAADWTTPRCGPAFMQKDTRRLPGWLASTVDFMLDELGRSDGEASAAGGGDGEDGGGGGDS